MNFDTKYLIRWGIPGWIMVMTLCPYFLVTYIDKITKLQSTSLTDIFAVGAVLTVLGVPLGYLLNQVHHSLFWVIPKFLSQKKYFKQEVKVDGHLEASEFKKARYRYLLSKKHELGGVSVSMCTSAIAILFTNIYTDNSSWSWIYFGVVAFLSILIVLSRNYSSKNVHYYLYDHLLKLENASDSSNDNSQ